MVYISYLNDKILEPRPSKDRLERLIEILPILSGVPCMQLGFTESQQLTINSIDPDPIDDIQEKQAEDEYNSA